MSGKGSEPDLRDRAETALGDVRRALPSRTEIESLLHELDIHRVELEMQNDELRSAQKDLTAMRDRYRLLYDQAPVGYLTLDEAGRIVETNERARMMLTRDGSSVAGTALSAALTEKDADKLHVHLERVRSEGYDDGCEVTLISEGGPGLPVHVTSRAATDPSGQRCGSWAALIDLTQLRHAENSVKVLEARNHVIFDGAREPILRCSGEWRIEAVNAAAADLFGGRAENLVGRNLRELIPELGSMTLEDSSRLHRQVLGRHADGQMIPLELRLGQWTEGGDQKLMVFLVDATEKNQREEELRQAHKMEAVGTLASGVAHDFNNVLQAVLGCLLIARAEETPIDDARAMMDRAAFAVRHGGELARGLLAFARRRKVDRTDVDFDRLIRATTPLIERLVGEHVDVQVSLGAERLRILADPVQLEQILMNLAANARDAMPDGGTLIIRTEAVSPRREREGASERSRIRLVIEDTGTGMDAATRARIFEPFFTTKAAGQGTGLGMSTVFTVTDQLDGVLNVASEVGQGTRFTFTFPSVPRGRQTPHSTFPIARVFDGTVLLVEDEPVIRMSTRHHLEQIGLTVLEAEHGGEAREVFDRESSRIDLLVSDIVMPVMMGTVLAATLRQRKADLAVILITANPELAGLEIPEDAMVLQKPFGIDELIRAVQQVLPLRDTPPPAAIPPAPLPRETAAPGGTPDKAAFTILVVEDDEISGPVMAQLLEREGFRAVLATTVAGATTALQQQKVSLVVSDLRLPDGSGEELVATLCDPSVPVVFISGADDAPSGASFIQKPVDFAEMVQVIDRMLGIAHP